MSESEAIAELTSVGGLEVGGRYADMSDPE